MLPATLDVMAAVLVEVTMQTEQPTLSGSMLPRGDPRYAGQQSGDAAIRALKYAERVKREQERKQRTKAKG